MPLPALSPGATACSWRPLTPHIPASSPSSSGSSSVTSGTPAARGARTWPRTVAARAAGGGDRPGGDRPGSSSNGGRPHEPRRSKPDRKARKPGLFEVKVVTPPPRSLGVYALPTGYVNNGEEVILEGESYVVTSMVLKYKLHKGKYVRDHNRLEVQPTGRYFLNMMLDNLIHATYMGPTGEQD